MDRKDLADFEKWFVAYVRSYYTGDEVHDMPIRLKEEHTERVRHEIVSLGRTLDLSAEQMLVAETTALFHDLGRFKQYAVYGTFSDAESENHAALGLRELARHHVLSRCSKKERIVICKAIGLHNRRTLPEKGDVTALFFARLLRDADKLDIWRVFVDYYAGRFGAKSGTIVLGLPDGALCSSEILAALDREEMANTKDMVTLCDYKLLQISWVFDLNFAAACREVESRKYVETIAATLPKKKEIEEAVHKVRAYLTHRQTANQESWRGRRTAGIS
jgi:hypothetical protein